MHLIQLKMSAENRILPQKKFKRALSASAMLFVGFISTSWAMADGITINLNPSSINCGAFCNMPIGSNTIIDSQSGFYHIGGSSELATLINDNIERLVLSGSAFPILIGSSGTIGLSTGSSYTAVGSGSIAGGTSDLGRSTALGAFSSASGQNSVALGAESSDSGVANVVSVGTPTKTRKITNVTAGENDTDAANVGQVHLVQQHVDSLVTSVATNTADIIGNTTAITANQAATVTAQTTANTALTNAATAQSSIDKTLSQLASAGVCKPAAGGGLLCGTSKGSGAQAIGSTATADGENTLAVGTGAVAKFAGSVAIGAGAKALADPTTALGSNAVANGDNSVALGANTTANGSNSVALGQGSIADRANSVSVGNTGQTRQITNLAAGSAPTDAVNVAQLNHQVNQGVGRAQDFASQGIAQALAVPAIPQLAVGKKWVGVANGNYAGQSAIGVAMGYQATEKLNFGAGVSSSINGNSHIATKVQLGYSW